MKVTALSALLLALAVHGPAVAAGDASAGQAKSAACAGCHAADGNSTNPEWPKLAGQHPGYVAKQLADFKAGKERSNALMAGMVAALSEQDMQDLAAYFAAQQAAPNYAEGDEETLARGRKIYMGGNLGSGVAACMSCHGPNGTGNPQAGFPSLSGQHAKYTAMQLHAFKKAERSNDAHAMMRDVARRMTDAEIEAVSQYIAGLH